MNMSLMMMEEETPVFIKRDGWTMMPQLPTEAGDYVLLHSGKSKAGRYAGIYCVRLLDYDFEHHKDIREYGFRQDEDWYCIAWRKIDVPEWWEEFVPQEVSE